jgi:heat shock protein HslJ
VSYAPRRRVRLFGTASAFAASLLLSACTFGGPASTPAATVILLPGGLAGTWTEDGSDSLQQPYISVEEDGTFRGSDGCNTLSGTWTYTDSDGVVLGDIASTKIACEGIDTWLSQAATARVQAGVMTVHSADGTILGRLEGS